MRIYAIGDIHGQLEMLKTAHARIAADRSLNGDENAQVVHLGDLVDRGPDSRGVIQFLIDGIAESAPWIVLKGNHDQIFESHIRGDLSSMSTFSGWCSNSMGGADTLTSYHIDASFWASQARARRKLAEAVPDAHMAFLKDLPLFHQTMDLLFVHAGIRPGLPMNEQIADDLMWIRHDFLDDPRDHGKLVVHGHTPVAAPMHCGNRVNLDSGAGYGRPLTAAVFEGRTCHVLTDEGRQPLLPVG